MRNTNLAILFETQLIIGKFERDSLQPIQLEGVAYDKRVSKDYDVIFYDWLIDEEEFVRGLEIHVEPQHPLFRSKVPLNSIDQIELDCFVRIWFQKDRIGHPAGIEAFDDILFLQSEDNALAIAVGTEWLSPKQSKQLLDKLPLISS